jgi:hypothetical protein
LSGRSRVPLIVGRMSTLRLWWSMRPTPPRSPPTGWSACTTPCPWCTSMRPHSVTRWFEASFSMTRSRSIWRSPRPPGSRCGSRFGCCSIGRDASHASRRPRRLAARSTRLDRRGRLCLARRAARVHRDTSWSALAGAVVPRACAQPNPRAGSAATRVLRGVLRLRGRPACTGADAARWHTGGLTRPTGSAWRDRQGDPATPRRAPARGARSRRTARAAATRGRPRRHSTHELISDNDRAADHRPSDDRASAKAPQAHDRRLRAHDAGRPADHTSARCAGRPIIPRVARSLLSSIGPLTLLRSGRVVVPGRLGPGGLAAR